MRTIHKVHLKQSVPLPGINGKNLPTKTATADRGRRIFIEMPFLLVQWKDSDPVGVPLGGVHYVEFTKGEPEPIAGDE